MIALCCRCDTVSVVISAGDESTRPAEGLPAPKVPADAVRNPAQVSFWLLEPVADAAMTYFYAQLFAMDTEIRAMFPAAMDLQRRRPSRLIHYDLPETRRPARASSARDPD